MDDLPMLTYYLLYLTKSYFFSSLKKVASLPKMSPLWSVEWLENFISLVIKHKRIARNFSEQISKKCKNRK